MGRIREGFDLAERPIFRPIPAVRAQVEARKGATSELSGKHPASTGKGAREVTPEVAPEVTPEVTPEVMRLLPVLKAAMDRQSLQKILGLAAEKNFRLVYLRPALELGLIEMTIRHKPRSSKQSYRITAKGKETLMKLRRPGKKR